MQSHPSGHFHRITHERSDPVSRAANAYVRFGGIHCADKLRLAAVRNGRAARQSVQCEVDSPPWTVDQPLAGHVDIPSRIILDSCSVCDLDEPVRSNGCITLHVKSRVTSNDHFLTG